MDRKNLIVGQSGGPTAVINSSLYGIVKGGRDQAEVDRIYGMVNGIEGFLKGQVMDFDVAFPGETLETLKYTPGAYLGSCRHKLPENLDDLAYKQIFASFHDMNIGYFVYIGGNDSMDTVMKLDAYLKREQIDICVVGVPKTIDNDLMETDHTPGFGSAAKYVAISLQEIIRDSRVYSIPSVTIVEIMGRDAGWLAASSCVLRANGEPAPHLIYLPEVAFDKEQFITDLKEMVKKYKNVIVAVSEGIRDKDGNYISATDAAADKFGHAQLSGAGKTLEYLVKEKLGIKVRSVEVNVLQRCAGHMASMTDLTESFLSGKHAVVLAKNGESAQMVSLHRLSNAPYTYELSNTPVSEVANQAKEVPVSWITPDHHDVTAEMIAYLKPLVAGEVPTDYADGIADYLDVSHLTKVYGK